MLLVREPQGRQTHQIRPISAEVGATRYAEGSVLYRSGHTQVLCTATIEDEVPPWLRNKGKGWVTAEYSMLPRATHTRTKRDREKVSGRTQEIQRLIGRALRGMVRLEVLGERQVIVDCDVLQADGGTRTAAISGGCIALLLALNKWVVAGKIKGNPSLKSLVTDTVSAVSVGMHENQVLVDLDYQEDSTCDVDMNFVITGASRFVEVQGTAEGRAFAKEQMDAMTQGALAAAQEIRDFQLRILREAGVSIV